MPHHVYGQHDDPCDFDNLNDLCDTLMVNSEGNLPLRIHAGKSPIWRCEVLNLGKIVQISKDYSQKKNISLELLYAWTLLEFDLAAGCETTM